MAMLRDENLYRSANYNIFDADITFELDEGNLSYDGDIITAFGDDECWKFSARLRKGDLVELVPTGSFTVKKATGTKPIIGEIIDSPQWDRGTRCTKENLESGEYPKRVATVRVYGSYIHELPLVAENAEIKAGDCLEFDADEQAFDKSSSTTSVVALEAKGALVTGRIATLMGSFAIE